MKTNKLLLWVAIGIISIIIIKKCGSISESDSNYAIYPDFEAGIIYQVLESSSEKTPIGWIEKYYDEDLQCERYRYHFYDK